MWLCASYCDYIDYAVGYNIYWVSDHGIWTLTGARVEHGNSVNYNHWMTSNAAYGIYDTTVDYQAAHPGLVLANDMALPFGGKFDINGGWATNFHSNHDMGTSVDINGIPIANEVQFTDLCKIIHFAADARVEVNAVTGARHIHCRWPY